MKFAIQVQFDGRWLFVMESNEEKVKTYPDSISAGLAARQWVRPNHPEAVRVVEYRR